MSLALIDIGSNLTHSSFADDLPEVLARAAAAGVTRQVLTGTDLASSRAAAALAALHPGTLWSTAGVHPHHAAEFDVNISAALRELLERPATVAVGECGLDYYRDLAPRAAQRAAFIAQLKIAAEVGKPVFLHERDAHEDFKAILAEFRSSLTGGVAHCFAGGTRELEAYLSLGLHIGITGWICDERRGVPAREAVSQIPARRLMIETDAPYLLPRDLAPRPKSRRNEPAHLPHIARTVALLRNEPIEAVAQSSTENAVRFFALEEPRSKGP